MIDFAASWCGPCRFIEPYFNQMAAKYTDVSFARIDVDELPVGFPSTVDFSFPHASDEEFVGSPFLAVV